jgi:cytochrome c peroxidase
MNFTGKNILFWCMLLVVVSGCQKENDEVPQASFQGLVVPSYFPPTHYQFINNPITESGFELGRKLFYDKQLSVNNTISCGSCHAQVHGFADHGVPLSFGIYGREGKRNAPPIFNMAWHPTYMWDGGITHIEVMPLAPLLDTLEMGETVANILEKLQNDPSYPPLFEKAFGSTEINDQRMLWAFAQFMSMIVSNNSKYDQVKRGETTFTAIEQQGYALFQAKCNSCHTEPLFTDFSYRNNGLDTEFTDLGRNRITQDPADLGKFKVPSLRNLEFTYPFMHDGRFSTINKVLDHYEEGVVASASLDPLLSSGIPLTDEERTAIKAFLYTLNDFTYIGDQRFAEP